MPGGRSCQIAAGCGGPAIRLLQMTAAAGHFLQENHLYSPILQAAAIGSRKPCLGHHPERKRAQPQQVLPASCCADDAIMPL